ncbi:MAG: hypothetical protein RSB88_09105 [Akkermansia sp.]
MPVCFLVYGWQALQAYAAIAPIAWRPFHSLDAALVFAHSINPNLLPNQMTGTTPATLGCAQ